MRASRLACLLLGLIAGFALLAPAAGADTSSTLTVVGTSDVSDSGLVRNVIQPQFSAAFPQFTFKYVGSATGTAIQNAESGNGGPSVLIVHAASLENQFVAGGFSYNSQYGNALFTNDFVLAGPTAALAGASAGTSAGAANNIARAFADVARSGVAGRATFVTRGGTTTASGTTVEEHALWGLVASAGLVPSGVVLCTVSAADGGGMSPISPSVQSASRQACPDSGTVNGTDAPGWYYVNGGANQGANVIAANACTVGTSGGNSCYVLSDRGTFDYLASGLDPAGAIPNLKIVTRDNAAGAPGGATALINYFHAYIINPSVSGETVNLTAAQDFVSLLTSPAFQSQLKAYLANTSDPAGPPFVADASPTVSASGFPAAAAGGKPVTVTGSVTNNEPGYAPIAGRTVTVDELSGGIPVPVATGTTNAGGGFSITFTPGSSGSYQVSTGQISQVEISKLSPVYGDILSPAASAAVRIDVRGAVTINSARGHAGGATVSGSIAPPAPGAGGTVSILARPLGSRAAYAVAGRTPLKAGQESYAAPAALRPGRWQLETRYDDAGQVLSATSAAVPVTVPARTVSFRYVSVRRGKLTVRGALSQAPTARGARVLLLARRTHARPPAARSRGTSFARIGKTSVRAGATGFTIRARLRRGYAYALRLELVQRGPPSSSSSPRSLNVN